MLACVKRYGLMIQLDRILVATDFSDFTRTAPDYACALAARCIRTAPTARRSEPNEIHAGTDNTGDGNRAETRTRN